MANAFWTRTKVIAVLVILLGGGIAAVGVWASLPRPASHPQLTSPQRDCGQLQQFSSEAELRAHLQAAPPGIPWMTGDVLALGAGGSARSGTSYSGTNVQVAGVDEADVVKTDGAYIYTVTSNYSRVPGEVSVAIVRAYPPASAAVVSEIPVESGYVHGLFVSGDRLAVIEGGWSILPLMPGPGRYPYWRGDTRVLVYDVSDRAAPALVRNVTVTGSYIGARMIGDEAYVVVQDYLYLGDAGLVMPTVWTDGAARNLTYADVRYFNDSGGSNVETSVLALNLTSTDPPTVESFLTRGGYQLYMSAENLYISGIEWDYGPDRRVWSETSTVHKVAVSGADVRYLCSVRVPGTILNQFSMDEHDGYLRVATTLGQWTPEGRDTSAAVFVFDAALNPTGNLTGLAPGERVFAARFLGDRAYLVTFRQVDPLFVLDVSDPTAPRVLGYLKIPGVSDYLHPYDATHLIGVGQESTDGGRLQGVKLSLFDVADVEHPAEAARYVIGAAGGPVEEWAYSEALYDHKAFLFIPARDLVVIPISIWSWDGTNSTGSQGAYVLSVTPQAGFTLRATITHGDPGVEKGRGDDQVRRSLYIGDYLYTVSNGLVLANHLDTFAEAARVPL